jgi:hypothetical protein
MREHPIIAERIVASIEGIAYVRSHCGKGSRLGRPGVLDLKAWTF